MRDTRRAVGDQKGKAREYVGGGGEGERRARERGSERSCERARVQLRCVGWCSDRKQLLSLWLRACDCGCCVRALVATTHEALHQRLRLPMQACAASVRARECARG
jgi:hypothetical protein